MTDKRRYGVIETVTVNSSTYWLTINGVMWAEVEWSPSEGRGASKPPPADVSPMSKL